MTESAFNRRDKRVVEFIIRGFSNAQEAIKFGNTVEFNVQQIFKGFKFCQEIGSPDTELAITPEWKEETVLKIKFLEIDQNKSQFVIDRVNKLVSAHEKVHKKLLNVLKIDVKEKPQPQFATVHYIPSTAKINSIG